MSTAAPLLATPEQLALYEPVIGLEVHVQLGTRTKIFCACPNEFGAAPNTNVCPVCLGMPGALPVLNRAAVELGVRAALALHCTVRRRSVFARKNYFYPDLPKGYQISQYDQPLAEHGWIEIATPQGARRIGVRRLHLEDDAGKSTHDGYRDSDRYSYVDLNRTGAPLAEIVSEPDIRSAEEAYEYLTQLKLAMQFAGVSNCDMEKGNLRCDANVSVRRKGAAEFGTKVEIKNLNSFRFLRQAIEFEISRQVALLESGGTVIQETRLYNPDLDETFVMRSKEEAHDYRYFPEPDLLPLVVSEEWLEEIRRTMPEMPADMRRRFVEQYGLREYDAQVLTASRELAVYFETVARACGDARAACNWVTGDLAALLKAEGQTIETCPVAPETLAELIVLVRKGELTGKLAKEILPKMFATRAGARAIMEREGLRAMSDAGELEKIVDGVIEANPKQVEQYRGGKTTVLQFFVGQVMKATRGQANPAAVAELLRQKLG
ncbi:MAG: Asp-tRNA(Asn)/Glu-tRNA(Gln) amidotransferase subunit GatB [Bryobacteraceae bacterium]